MAVSSGDDDTNGLRSTCLCGIVGGVGGVGGCDEGVGCTCFLMWPFWGMLGADCGAVDGEVSNAFCACNQHYHHHYHHQPSLPLSRFSFDTIDHIQYLRVAEQEFCIGPCDLICLFTGEMKESSVGIVCNIHPVLLLAFFGAVPY